MIKSLFIRKKNNKFCVICEYRDNTTKKKHQKQLGAFERKRDANVLLNQEKVKLDQGMFISPNSDIKFSDYLLQWNDYRKNRLSLTTYNYYKYMIEKRYGPESFLGQLILKDITPILLDEFLRMLQDEGLQENTIAKHYKMLNKALSDAKRKQLIYKNVCDYVEKPKVSKSEVSKILTLEQAKYLLKEASNTIYELPINLALGLGLRAGEIFGLTWENVNFENNTIYIAHSLAKDKGNNKLFLKEPKTANSKRLLFVPDSIMDLFQKQKRKTFEKENNEYNLVFLNRLGRPFDPSDFTKNFRKFLINNGLEVVRFHDLRHTNASLHLLAGTDMKVTSKNLGHSNIQITADLYTHVLEDLDKDATNALNNLLYSNKE